MAAKKYSLLAALALSGCSTIYPLSDVVDSEPQQQDIEIQAQDEKYSPLASSITFQKQFKLQHNSNKDDKEKSNSTTLNQDINHYVKVLMQDLVNNLHHFNSSTPVAIVSFVMLDSDYNSSNLIGMQIAESLIHEVHNFGIPVIDYKTTGFVRVTPQGDFAFSKNNEELPRELVAQYIIGGTMVKHKDGFLVNARIVGMASQTVVASAQSLIPNAVVNALFPNPKFNTEPKTVQLLDDTALKSAQ